MPTGLESNLPPPPDLEAGTALAPGPPSPCSSQGQSQPSGPVGSGNYVVQPGDCIESIAFTSGHFWRTLWDHPDNQQLKSVRKDPNVLLPGDRVAIPDLRPKHESGATEQRHRFKRKGVPSELRLVLLENDKPFANEPYQLEIDGRVTDGQTAADGSVELPIPPNARDGRLIVSEGSKQRIYHLDLGGLAPVTEISGIKSRLRNLGYPVGSADDTLDTETTEALELFQQRNGLTVTGQPDQATRDKLIAAHGC